MCHDNPIALKSILAVFLLFAFASVLSHQSGLDLWLAEHLYSMEGGSSGEFPLRHNFWLYAVIHEGGRALVKRMFFLVLALFLASFFVKRIQHLRPAMLFVLLSTLVSTGLVSFLKHHTTIPCPQALQEFGGSHHWLNIWQVFAPELPRGSCYPAGHASGGYAWLCLAFLFPYGSRSFYWALTPGILLGLSFGLAQQLRGAHFLSHDLLTIGVIWLVSGSLFSFMRSLRTCRPQGHNNPILARQNPA